jgi:hypothetical protein
MQKYGQIIRQSQLVTAQGLMNEALARVDSQLYTRFSLVLKRINYQLTEVI